MSILVVYHLENLLNPAKVLTHAEDIAAELKRAGITFALTENISPASEVFNIESLSDCLKGLTFRYFPGHVFEHADLLSHEAQPGYALSDPATAEQEHWHAEDGIRLFVEGGGTLCIRAETSLFALSCVRGTLVALPAGTAHWFRQRNGAPCSIARLAPSAAGLQRNLSGDDIASRLELPEL